MRPSLTAWASLGRAEASSSTRVSSDADARVGKTPFSEAAVVFSTCF